MKVNLITLGCPKNVVDSEIIQGGLSGANIEFTDGAEEVDAIIINTCGFIQSAKEEAIETIFEAVELKKKGRCKKVIVTGCLVNRYFKELPEQIPEVDGFVENRELPTTIRRLARQLGTTYKKFPARCLLTAGHYAYLKIAEGCNNRCSYCAIPLIRGPLKSRWADDIVTEAETLVENGTRELIVIAEDITNYGADLLNSPGLVPLLQRLVKIESLEWVRLMYSHPAYFTDELVEFMASEEKVCKYIDLPIQHISNPILARMRRRVTRQQIEKVIEKLRKNIPDIAIRTSLIIGFPGETDEDFNELVDFVDQTKFERLGAFSYSAEEGTPAFEYENQIESEVLQERLDTIMNLQADISLEKNLSRVGTELKVVIDEYEPDLECFLGRTQWDAPEIDNTVLIKNQKTEIGKFYQVRVKNAYEFDLLGEIVKSV